MLALIRIGALLGLLTIIFLLPLLFSHWLAIYALSKKTLSAHHKRAIFTADWYAALIFFIGAFALIFFLGYYPEGISTVKPLCIITKPAIWAINKIAGPPATTHVATAKLATMIVFTLIYMLSWLLALINTFFLMHSFKKHEAMHVSLTKAIAINSIALIFSFISVPLVFFIISAIINRI